MEQLNKFVFELENNTVNKVTQMLKDFDERMTLNNLRLSQRYIDGQLRLIMHIRFADEEYVAIFERFPDAAWHSETPDARYSSKEGCCVGDLKHRSLEGVESDEQSVVLVGNVQFVDRPEKLIPTLVRKGSVNSVYSTLPHALYSSMSLGFVFRGKLPDREGGLLTRVVPRNKNELVCEVVESASDVMDNVARSKRDFGGRLSKDSDAMDCLSRLRIVLSDDSLCWGFPVEIIPDDRFQVTDVLVGPFNFYADKSKSLVSSHERV